MTKIDYSKLFSYINREVDQETRKEVECWRKADVCHEAFYKRVRDYYHADPTANKKFTTEELDCLFEAMLKEKRSRRRIAFQQRVAVAASIVALLACCRHVVYYKSLDRKEDSSDCSSREGNSGEWNHRYHRKWAKIHTGTAECS